MENEKLDTTRHDGYIGVKNKFIHYTKTNTMNTNEEKLQEEFEYAVRTGNVDIVEQLLEEGIDINVRTQLLVLAIENRNYEIIQLLLEIGVNINTLEVLDLVNELLLDASVNNQYNIIGLLLEEYEIPLHPLFEVAVVEVAEQGNLYIMEMLISYGTLIDDSVLIQAAQSGHTRIVKVLLEKYGVDPNVENSQALINTSYKGHFSIAKLLLKHGANISAHNNLALVNASRYEHIDLVKLFLSAGADVGTRDNEVIILASMNGRTDIVELLLRYGADPSAQDNEALRVARNDETRILLLDYGAEPIDEYTLDLDEALDRQAYDYYQKIGEPFIEWLGGHRRIRRLKRVLRTIQDQ